MTDHTDLHDDDVLVRELGVVLEALEPTPTDAFGGVLAAAWQLRRPGLVVADLVSDTMLGELAGVRSGGGERVLTYDEGGVTLELVIDEARRSIVGHVIPPDDLRVQLVTPAGEEELAVDDVGTFAVPPIGGPIRLTVFPSTSAPFTTPIIESLLPPQ